MRIGIIAPANSTHTVKIVNSLCEAGDEVFLYSLPNHRDAENAISERAAIRYLRTGGSLGYFLNAGNLKTLLQNDAPNVLSAHYASGYGTLARKCGFHPYSLSVWGSDVYAFPRQNKIKRFLLKKNLDASDMIMSTSKCMAEETLKYTRKSNITVTPFGVNTDIFSPPRARKSDGPVRIVFVKSIAEPYGLEFLIDAVSKLVNGGIHDIRLDIYGDGDKTEEMKKLASTSGVDDITFFHGRIEHTRVAEVLKASDIMCVPSLAESFGVSAIEAMACGLPCVTSDAPGLAEVMEDGITGFIVPAGSSQKLAEKLNVLIEDEALRKSMGLNGRKRVLEYYDWKNNFLTYRNALTMLAKHL